MVLLAEPDFTVTDAMQPSEQVTWKLAEWPFCVMSTSKKRFPGRSRDCCRCNHSFPKSR